MAEEKFYVLEDGTELVLVESVKFNDIRYLLLSSNSSDAVVIAYESNGKLIYVDEDSDVFSTVAMELFKKISNNLK